MRASSATCPRRRSVTVVAGGVLVTLALSVGIAGASAANPTVSGPITGGSDVIVPANLLGLDLADIGYEQSEFFLEGTADAYSPAAPLTTDGMWTVAPSDPAPFATRAVVYRPIKPSRFNGTVLVEWLNVSAGVDASPDWTQTHNELVRDGYAWVGVSAQAAGTNQLECPVTVPVPPVAPCPAPGDPVRYETLAHPGDSYSYDIFSQAGQAIRDDAAILDGLKAKRLLAVGESQSAGRMVTYIDAVHPLVRVYDGFLVHSRGGGGAALSQAPRTPVAVPIPTLIRTDLDEPVFVFQTESDVASGVAARQPDTDRFRAWEAAGTAHFDHYGLAIGPGDIGDGEGAVANLEAMQDPPTSPAEGAECARPINTGGAHWLLNSAVHWLNRWVTDGTPPPGAPVLETESTSPFVPAKDANGNTMGGVRTPHVDAPIAALGGFENSGAPGNTNLVSQFCRVFGSTGPYPPEQLQALYGNRAGFVSAWRKATKSLVKAGFLLEADQQELIRSAAHAQIGN